MYKRPLWQWLLIYAVIGGVIYFLIYYFIMGGNKGYGASSGTDYNMSATPSSQQDSTSSGY